MSDQAGPAPGDRVVIGITFGNSNSSIAVTVDDRVEVIANEDGDRQIPTILSYVDGDEYYGQQAKNFLVRKAKHTVAYFRDFLGKDFQSIDPTHNHASARPAEANGTITFSLNDKEDEEQPSLTLTVSETSTRYIRRLVTAASEYLGKTVTSAVVTIPTNFSDAQKAALTEAAKNANLEILQMVSEPVAAILAYDARPDAEIADKVVVVADLGGTKSDVAVVASRGGMYTVLATAHDYEFAGFALDKVLMDHFAKEFLKRNPGIDPRENARSLAKLRLEAEATKKALSLGNNASFSVESLADGRDFATNINRLRYETLARPVFEGMTRLVEGVLKKAGLDVLDVDEVILSGGTSHTPRIANNLQSLFPESTTIQAPATTPTAINPSELQVRGAALQASLIQEYEVEDIEQSTHAAVTTVPHITDAIGVVSVLESGEEVFTPIVPPQTAVPARRTIQIIGPKTGGDVLLKVTEGNTHIKVTKPEPKPKKEPESNGKKATVEDDDEAEEDSDFDDSEEEEEEDKRERVWKIGQTLAEVAVRGVKKNAKIEITVNVSGNLETTITAREVGAKSGVRGAIPA